MTVLIRHPEPHVYAPSPPPAFAPRIRPARMPAERPFVLHAWTEGYKDAPAMRRLRWADYKAREVPLLDECVDRRDTTVLVAADPAGIAVGWIAFARWPGIDVVHWVYVAMQHRGRGVGGALLAGLGDRIAYTHQGPVRRKTKRADLRIAESLRAAGKTVSYSPYKEWSK